MQLSLHCDSEVQNKKEGGQDFLCGLWNRVRVHYWHLVGRDSLSVCLVLAGGAAHCGSAGQWWCRGGVGGVVCICASCTVAAAGASASGGRCDGRLLFGLFTGKLCDAEDKLQAAQFNVAPVVEQGRALPPRTAASNQAGAARLAGARLLGAALGLAAHHATRRQKTHHRARTLALLALLTATDDALDFGHQTAGCRW